MIKCFEKTQYIVIDVCDDEVSYKLFNSFDDIVRDIIDITLYQNMIENFEYTRDVLSPKLSRFLRVKGYHYRIWGIDFGKCWKAHSYFIHPCYDKWSMVKTDNPTFSIKMGQDRKIPYIILFNNVTKSTCVID